MLVRGLVGFLYFRKSYKSHSEHLCQPYLYFLCVYHVATHAASCNNKRDACFYCCVLGLFGLVAKYFIVDPLR